MDDVSKRKSQMLPNDKKIGVDQKVSYKFQMNL